jgi:hypothetical protein
MTSGTSFHSGVADSAFRALKWQLTGFPERLIRSQIVLGLISLNAGTPIARYNINYLG